MPYVFDRVKDSTTSIGTGAIVLNNTAPTAFRTFATAAGPGNTTVEYAIIGIGTTEWEVGRGVFNGTTGLSRDIVRSSSNNGNLVNFSAGSKDVYSSASAEFLDNCNIGLQLATARGWSMP